jgi:hypothetical protein
VRVKHKTHCSRFTGTCGQFALLLGLLKQHLECFQFQNSEEVEMAELECKSLISELLNFFQLGINTTLCVEEYAGKLWYLSGINELHLT